MEFDEVRRYQAGDDIRTIDWKVTARADGTYTKLFREERERPCHLIVDQRDSLFFGSTGQFKSVLAAELAVALGWAAFSAGDRVGAQIIGKQTEIDIRARNSRKAVMKLVHDLHQINNELLFPEIHHQSESNRNTFTKGQSTQQDLPKSLAEHLEESRRILRPGSAVFLISDFYDINEASTSALSKLAKHVDLTLIQITDPLEQSLPCEGVLPISDGQQIASVRLNKRVTQRYQESLTTRDQQVNKVAARTGSRLIQASTRSNARRTLTGVYQTKG